MSQPLHLPISKTAAQIAPFRVMKILGQAKALETQGRDIIHMEIGEPDFASLPCVHQAAMQAAEKGITHYTPTLGLPALREKLSEFYQNFYNAKIPAGRVVITPGSSSALQLVLTAILNPNDTVLMPDPTYPCNRQFVELLQANVESIPVDVTTNYQLTTQLLEKHWQPHIKAVMVASPANPTGTLIEQEELLKMANFLAEKNCYFIVDEIYQGLVYDRPAESILGHEKTPENIAASFQKRAIGMLVKKLKKAIKDTGINRVVAGGGVSANSYLREELNKLHRVETYYPSLLLCTDNGAMIAGIAYQYLKRGDRDDLSLTACARVPSFKRRYP